MSNMLMMIPAAVFLTTAAFVFAVYRLMLQDREILKGRLNQYGMDIGSASIPFPTSSLLRENRLSAIGGMDRFLARREVGEKTALDLARAAVPLRVGEYILIRWLLALTLFVVGNLAARSIAIGLVLAVCGYFLPRFYVSQCEQRRIKRFNDHLVDTLSLMANSLRSGFGLLQGLEAVAHEMPDPVCEEFNRVLHEVRVGASTEEALINLTQRMRSPDLDLVVTAMLIQRSVGGNLSEVLDTIGHTIRERVRILREIKTLTAQERMSGYIIGALPIFLLVVLSFVNRSYIEMLFFTEVGRLMLAAGAVLEVIGFLIIRKIVDIEV